MFMGCLPKISIFWFPANPLAKSRDAGASDISSNSGNHFVWTCVGHYEVYYEVPNRERGSGKYLLGLLEGAELLLKYFSLSSRKRTENVKRPSRHISVSLVEKGGVLEM